MKNIILLLFFIQTFLIYQVNAEKTICDSWNINKNWITLEKICNWWYMTWSIKWVDSFTWSFKNLQTWYWWTNNNYNKDLNLEKNFPTWEFDANKTTKIRNTNPEYTIPVWYIWTGFNYNKNLDPIKNLPFWFFDTNHTTYIKNTNPDLSVPVWFLWNAVIEKKTKWSKKKQEENTYTYKEYFEKIFKDNSKIQYIQLRYKQYEYDKLINNLLEVLLNWDNKANKVISKETQNRIKLYVENNNEFKEKLSKLVKNLRVINKAFEKVSGEEKVYIIEYYLN